MAYDPTFIPGTTIPLPTLSPSINQQAFNNGQVIDHLRFSIIFNAQRGFALLTAHNVDGGSILQEGDIPRVDRFREDPNIPGHLQVDNARGYRNNPWDRGHLVRRRSLHWGDEDAARRSDNESYFWSNIVPQHETLHHKAWGKIENWMFDVTADEDRRACVFTGPVFTPDDPEITNQPGETPIKIPAGFWKVFITTNNTKLMAAGFLVWQRDYDMPTPLEFEPVLEQVRVTTIEYLTGISFGKLREVDPLRFGHTAPRVTRSTNPGSVDKIGSAIFSASDITLSVN